MQPPLYPGGYYVEFTSGTYQITTEGVDAILGRRVYPPSAPLPTAPPPAPPAPPQPLSPPVPSPLLPPSMPPPSLPVWCNASVALDAAVAANLSAAQLASAQRLHLISLSGGSASSDAEWQALCEREVIHRPPPPPFPRPPPPSPPPPPLGLALLTAGEREELMARLRLRLEVETGATHAKPTHPPCLRSTVPR